MGSHTLLDWDAQDRNEPEADAAHEAIDDVSVCPVCQTHVPWRWDLCKDCNTKYGWDRTQWPAWLHELVKDKQRNKTAERNAVKHLTALDGIETEKGQKVDLDQAIAYLATPRWERERGRPLKTREWPELVVIREWGWTCAIPWRPYGNEATDRRYRRANGKLSKPKVEKARAIDTTDLMSWGEMEADLEDRDFAQQIISTTRLTERQQQVWRLAAQGKREAEIGDKLSITQQAVSKHLLAIQAKLEAARERLFDQMVVKGG